MQKFFLIGNLTREPELTETSSGVSICRFTVAVNRNYTGSDGERKTDFFNCIAWRGLGETVARFARKGNKLAVVGSVEMRTYEDSEGAKRVSVDVVVQDVEFLTPRQSVGSGEGEEHAAPKGNAPSKQLTTFDDDGDIPF